VREPDATFSDPRQAILYDVFNNDRSDLEAYVRIADEVEAHRVVDVGCGTGSLAVRLAELGFSVIGVDPAGASLDVARAKPNAELVTWVHGDATSLLGLEAAADLAVMTGNVAQSSSLTRTGTPPCALSGHVYVPAAGWSSKPDDPRLETGRPGTSRRPRSPCQTAERPSCHVP
jgi:SAM-dependent methyltransferase